MANIPPPILFISPAELELLRTAFQHQHTLVETRLHRLITHELGNRYLPDTPEYRARITESDADCRFQVRIMTLDTQLLDHIVHIISQPQGVTLGRTDLYHLVRIVVAAGHPAQSAMLAFGDKLRTLDLLEQVDAHDSITLHLRDMLQTAPLRPLQ